MQSNQPHSDTAQLIDLARAGDSDAWSELYQRYRIPLSMVVRRQMNAKLRAELETGDVVQSGWLRASMRLESFEYRGPGSLFHWLRRIVSHRLRDRLRMISALRRQSVRSPIAIGSAAVPSREGDPAETLELEQTLCTLREAVDRLPTRERAVLLGHLYEGKSLSRLGVELGVSDRTARRLLKAGLDQLRRRLDSR